MIMHKVLNEVNTMEKFIIYNYLSAGKRHIRSDEERLLHDLLCAYDKEARPVANNSWTLTVTFELKLIQVVLVVRIGS